MDKLVEKCLLTPEEIGDNLKLEVEATYPCSNGGYTTTVSVDNLLETQLLAAIPIILREVVEAIKGLELPRNPYRVGTKKAWLDIGGFRFEAFELGKEETTKALVELLRKILRGE